MGKKRIKINGRLIQILTVDQLFYSPDTRVKVEIELMKIVDEPNPFRTGHRSRWGQHRETPESIGEMMDRWDETLEDSKLVKDRFDFYKQEFLATTLHKNLSNKKVTIEDDIFIHSKCKLGNDELSDKSETGFKNKGYRWFEAGEDFSLKDFITYHPQTISQQVYHKQIITYFHNSQSSPPIETLAEQAPLNELNFLNACEGYACAKYVAFLKSELNKILKEQDSDDEEYSLPPVSENLFKLIYVSKFRETENSLIELGYMTCINGRCQWRGTSDLLGTFVWALKEKGYFVGSNPEKITIPERSFFKSRYDKDFTQSAKPGFKKTKKFSKKIKEINAKIR